MIRALWRTFGARGAAARASFVARKRFNRLRARPSAVGPAVAAAPLPNDWPFRVDASRVGAATDRAEAMSRAERVLRGEHQAYRWTWMPRPLAPRDWRLHPTSGVEYDDTARWWRIPHFDPRTGDVKDVWEPARFGWAYDLVRGWMLTGDPRFAEAFWQGLESFLDGCPPFLGVQWSCGQEASIRAVAWLWAESAFIDAPASTPRRRARLRTALAWTAERVDDAIAYALSQRNNHGISEATGLVVIGARLRGHDPRAEGWLRRGRTLLQRQIRDQFGADGWYAQHSVNYARLALDQLVVAQRALLWAGTPLSARSLARLRAGVVVLADLADASNGQLPLHGANDGAYVLPLSTRPYRDFVPALTAAAATFGAPLPAELAPDGETLAWLSSDAPARAEAQPLPRLRTGKSGWADVRTEHARVFLRAGRYRSRPGHIDALHADVWIDGEPVATDAGTFRYAAPPPWANGLAGEEVHNTVTLPGRPMARRGPRFLWLTWPSARLEEARILLVQGERQVQLAAVNDSWRAAGIRHRRRCLVGDDAVVIYDTISARRAADLAVRLHWLLDGDAAPLIVADGDVTVSSISGAEDALKGWVSEGYGVRRRARSVVAEGRVRGRELTIISGFGNAESLRRLEPAFAGAADERREVGATLSNQAHR